MQHILLVDDDISLTSLLSEYLNHEGFSTSIASSGEEAIGLDLSTFQLIVLDIMMPGISGLEVLKHVRQTSNIPILMLTGRGDDLDRILGLELGADDYLGKPCNPRELVARINAILRRSAPVPAKATISNDWQVNTDLLTASYQGTQAELTQAEFLLLQEFLSNANATLSKAHLTQQVLNRPLEKHDRAIDVHVSRLRHKLAQLNCPSQITALRGRGYRWTES